MQKTECVHGATLLMMHLGLLLAHTVFKLSAMSLTLLRLPLVQLSMKAEVCLGIKARNTGIETIYIQEGEILNT